MLTYSELVGSQFINIRAISGNRFIPEAELQQELVLTGQEHVTPLLTEFCEFLQKSCGKRVKLCTNKQQDTTRCFRLGFF